MNNLVEIIDAGLERTGLTAAKASMLAVNNNGLIKNIRKGSSPSIENFSKLAQVLKIDFHISIPQESDDSQPEPPQKKIPVLGMAACGKDGWASLGVNDMSAIKPDRAMSDLSFAVIATGESLTPWGVLPGAVCYCDPKTPITEGQLVFIERRIKKTNKTSMTIKRILNIDHDLITVYGYRPSVLLDEDHEPEEYQKVQETFSEIVSTDEVIRMAVVCWVNTNPIL